MAVVRAEPWAAAALSRTGWTCLRRWQQLRSGPRVCDDRIVVAAAAILRRIR
jgi:hypothetical protein